MMCHSLVPFLIVNIKLTTISLILTPFKLFDEYPLGFLTVKIKLNTDSCIVHATALKKNKIQCLIFFYNDDCLLDIFLAK